MKSARQNERMRESKKRAKIESENQKRVASKRMHMEALDNFKTHSTNKKQGGEKDELIVQDTSLRDNWE